MSLKVLSLFSGIEAFERALENLNIPHEIVAYCEIDKFASKAYSLLHNISESKNLGDIIKIDTTSLPSDIDLVTYGFPCQDISIAGLQKGLEYGGEQTRSGLVWKAHEVIKKTLPKVAICENVKNLTSKKFKTEFEAILANLEDIGYNNYWKVLNAKDYGVPQNRERVFIISIRKDIDKGSFAFPKGVPLNVTLKDILDKDVDPKYFLSKKLVAYVTKGGTKSYKAANTVDPTIAHTIVASCHKMHRIDNYVHDKIIQVGNLYKDTAFKNPQRGRVYDVDGLSPALNTKTGGGLEPKIIIGSTQKHAAISENGVCPTLTSAMGQGGGHVPFHNYDERIRRLTPKECFKLMGFQKDDVSLLRSAKISDTQLYKMAGNSIVVDVLMAILKNLYHV